MSTSPRETEEYTDHESIASSLLASAISIGSATEQDEDQSKDRKQPSSFGLKPGFLLPHSDVLSEESGSAVQSCSSLTNASHNQPASRILSYVEEIDEEGDPEIPVMSAATAANSRRYRSSIGEEASGFGFPSTLALKGVQHDIYEETAPAGIIRDMWSKIAGPADWLLLRTMRVGSWLAGASWVVFTSALVIGLQFGFEYEKEQFMRQLEASQQVRQNTPWNTETLNAASGSGRGS